MAQDNGFDLARLQRMERRLQALEDAEAIRNLKVRDAALCDDQYDAEGIAALFTEDAIWESPALGRYEGRGSTRRCCRLEKVRPLRPTTPDPGFTGTALCERRNKLPRRRSGRLLLLW
jgi:hypothetical protein